VKKVGSSLIGNSGEHFVLAELLRRGIVAALAPRNMPDYDILAINGKRSLKIRVKTKTATRSFRWNAKADGTMFGSTTKNDVVILVDLGNLESPAYYAIGSAVLEKKMTEWMGLWLAEPKADGTPRTDTGQRFLYMGSHLQPYAGDKAWALIDRLLVRDPDGTTEEVIQQ
jgi:hypothetical protein